MLSIAPSRQGVRTEQRHTRHHPCLVCGGYEELPMGKGIRCWGYRSSDGEYEHCTRPECAGALDQHPASLTYPHRVSGPCRCGTTHSPAAPAIPDQPTGRRRRRSSLPAGKLDAIYLYVDENGTPVHRTRRYRDPKGFRQQRYDRGLWRGDLTGVRTVLYRLPALLAADPTQIVFLPEGEKDVDRLWTLGLIATTNPMGALHWEPRYSAWLSSRHVVILEDNDARGQERSRLLCRALRYDAASVCVIRFTRLTDGADVSDWLDAGGTPAALLRAARGGDA